MNNKLELMFRRRKAVLINKRQSKLSENYKATILRNLEDYGYTLSESVIERLSTLSENEAIEFYKELVEVIKLAVGFKEDFKPMYPNFPNQVMEMESSDLYINAIKHYISGGYYMPTTEEEERFPFFKSNNLNILDLVEEEEVFNVLNNLLSSNVSLSESDKADILFILDNYKDAINYIPSKIPFKENLIFITIALKERGIDIENIIKLYKTATDVLRFAVALSNGDISLSQKCHFISFKMADRKLILKLLESLENIEEDMVRYRGEWIRLGERIHPKKYKKYKKVNIAFEKIRNGSKIETFNSRLENAFNNKKIDKIVSLLSKRPGEFARNIDRLLRLEHSNKVIYGFGSVVDKISNNVLLQLIQHLENRKLNENSVRVFYPKSNTFKMYSVENNLLPLDERACNKVIEICKDELISRYANKDNLGKVYLDKDLKDIKIPMQQRTASKSLNNLVKGSKVKIPQDIKVIRAFVHWKNVSKGDKQKRVDLDLSASFLNENFEVVANLYYRNLRLKELNACHSGDITDAPNGAFEYVDFEIEAALKAGVRYVLGTVTNYTGQTFVNIPECFYGFMSIDKPQEGEIFEASRVVNKVDLSSDSLMVSTAIYDLKERKMITVDAPISARYRTSNNIVNNKSSIAILLENIINSNKPNLYDLFKLHIEARGIETSSISDADTLFVLDKNKILNKLGDSKEKQIISAFDNDIIIGDYL